MKQENFKSGKFFKSAEQKRRFNKHVGIPLGALALLGATIGILHADVSPTPSKEVPEIAANGEGMNVILQEVNKGILGGSVYDQNALAVGQTIIMNEVNKVNPKDASLGILPAGKWEVPYFSDAQK